MTHGSPDWLVSVDDHVFEPPNVWDDRVPAKYCRVAHIVTKGKSEVWMYEDIRRITGSAINATVHRRRNQIALDGQTYADMAPGCCDPEAADPATIKR